MKSLTSSIFLLFSPFILIIDVTCKDNLPIGVPTSAHIKSFQQRILVTGKDTTNQIAGRKINNDWVSIEPANKIAYDKVVNQIKANNEQRLNAINSPIEQNLDVTHAQMNEMLKAFAAKKASQTKPSPQIPKGVIKKPLTTQPGHPMMPGVVAKPKAAQKNVLPTVNPPTTNPKHKLINPLSFSPVLAQRKREREPEKNSPASGLKKRKQEQPEVNLKEVGFMQHSEIEEEPDPINFQAIRDALKNKKQNELTKAQAEEAQTVDAVVQAGPSETEEPAAAKFLEESGDNLEDLDEEGEGDEVIEEDASLFGQKENLDQNGNKCKKARKSPETKKNKLVVGSQLII